MSTRSDCRKFAPNIFNKSKCTNCFRQKEEHSAEALESNRASRKISKCGYLFVAPGWDFSNPLNRTKRWQRRWFVLYDDGELTYSLDEHPDTVPQACVDMTLVLEVRDADEVTGHPFSLAITSPDRVTFIKGTCREETRWWSDVLSVYPRNKGRHKRNATFPGGQTTSLIQNGTAIRNGAGNLSRPRHNSCHAGAWVAPSRPTLDAPTSGLPTAPTPPLATPETKVYTDQPVSSASPPTRDKINSEDKARSRRGTARGRSRATWNIPDNGDAQDEGVDSVHHRILIEEYESESKREEKLKDIALSLTRPRERGILSPPGPDQPTREVTVSPDVMSPTLESPEDSVDGIPDKYVRGDPDGCVRGAAARVELPAEGLLNMRKGWLLRQANSSQTARHWFVLRGAALLYYRDPSAEDCGIMDGVIDLNGVNSVTETPPTRTYGFAIKTWDNRQYILSALTAVNRTNWVSAIRRTAGLPENPIECPQKLYPEKPLLNLERQESIDTTDSLVSTPITPITPRSILLSSDEEYRTASEGGRRDSVDWGDPVSNLPPSPVPSRNPISRVKDKVRSRSCQFSSSIPSPQSDETPPSDIDETDSHQNRSMREIIDPYPHIVKEKKIHDDVLKPLKSTYVSTIDKQAIEIEDLRKQLKIAVNDVNSAEKELKRLRQIKSESILREKKIDELLATLQKTEDELKRRTKEAENLQALKKMYNEDKTYWENKLAETEAFLKDSSQHCERLNKQLENGQETINQLQNELSQLNERLVRGAEENEALYLRIRDLEGRSGSTLSITRIKGGRSVESLSDLANIDLDQDLESMEKDRIIEEYDELRNRFEKAIHEIRAMKRELRESHNLYDELELANLSLKRDIQLREETNQSQITMMADRIQDLTNKLSVSDKHVRALKHKLQKSESRDKRRSLSLKGKDSLSLGKEVEDKLTELESKISQLEGGNVITTAAPVIQPPSKPASPSKEKSPSPGTEQDSKSLKRLSARLRRKSLDSATSSEPMKMLIRLSSLESKVGNAMTNKSYMATSCESLMANNSDSNTPESSESFSTSSSHRHLLDRLQSLENVVIASRNKVNECICQVSTIRASKSRRSPSPILEKTYSMKSIERSLTDVSRTLQDCADKCVLPFDSILEGEDINASVINIVNKLESQLRTKLLDINKKKCALLESGELNQRRSLEFLAEKLAYEAVLISRINDAVTNIHGDSLLRKLSKSEAEETSQLVTSLQSKLNGTIIKCQTSCKNSMDYLAKILSRKISSLNPIALDKMNQSQNILQTKEIEMLKALQKDINVAVEKYKSEKMVELTKALIIEALNCHPDDSLNYDQQRTNLESLRIQEAWNNAQDIVNAELINSEISHVMKRCTQYYASQLESDKRSRFTLVASQQVALEKWFQAAHQQLSKEMNKAIVDITSHYQECLTTVRLRSPLNEDQPAVDSRQLLFQLADVIAHKALIDAKIYVCSGGYDADFELTNDVYSSGSKNTTEEKIWSRMSESDNVIASLDIDPTQEAEFIYLFQHFSNECRALFSDEFSEHKKDLLKINDALSHVESVVKRLLLQVDDGKGFKGNSSKDSDSKTQLQSVLDLCDSLKTSVEALSTHIPCQDCLRLQNALSRLRSEHEETLATLKVEKERNIETKRSLDLVRGRARTAEELVSSLQQQHKSAQRRAQRSESDVKQLKQQIADHESECEHLKAQHEQEQHQLKERARRLEKRLGTLDSEYSQQLEQLRSAYNKSLSADLQGDSIRQRYQAEIEQLRVLCEKGLMAMENSHRRILQEMEEKHKSEKEQLKDDKEQALAEETRATLAALDAMRKAHENEVQREVSKFKREFTTRTHSSGELTQIHMKHQQEMEEIKKEIISLSEKYSSKCVESAALEEKLCNVTQQLTQAQQHILQLDARNKQLRAHLVSEINEMNNIDCNSLSAIREDIITHEQGTDGVRITPKWNPLRRIAWQKSLNADTNKNQSVDTGTSQISSTQDKDTICKDRKHKESKTFTSAELRTFPRTTRYSKLQRHASISPLLGIVAERKKRFEPEL